jgi:hypothetical protein
MPGYLGWSGPPLFTVLTKGIDGLSGAQLMQGSFPADGFRAIGRRLALLHSPEGLAEVPCVTRRYLPTFFLATGAAHSEPPLLALPLAEERLELLLDVDGDLPRPDRLRALLDRWTATSLIHADLRLRHVFARRRGRGFEVTLCDWEDACAGDGLFDVGCLAASVIIEWYEGGLALSELDLRAKLRSLIEGYAMARARFDPGTFVGYAGVALIQALAENQRYWTDQTARHIWALAAKLVNDMDSIEIQRLIGAAP